MSQRERDRLVVVHQVAEGLLKGVEGARRLGVSTRHMRRLLRRWEREGDGAMAHGLRGQPSNRRLAGELRALAMERARDPLYHDFGPTLLTEHLEREEERGRVHPSTVRLWMIEEGLWKPKKRRMRHRKRRERRAAWGELVLMDTSIHPWLEERSTEDFVLIALMDDATSRLVARFFPRDTGAANRELLIAYMARHGRMGALYADRAGHFRVNFRRRERKEQDKAEAMTLIHRGLAALDIELIIALSPQAKGRVERLFGTLQDRLIKEMRVRGIASMEEANRFLEEEFIPFWNERFTVEPQERVDAHRALPDTVDLLQVFAETEERSIREDYTFRYDNRFYQIEAHDACEAMRRSKITLEQRLDGTLRFRWRGRYLLPTPLLGPPPKPEPRAPPIKAEDSVQARPPAGAASRPVPPNHPWRRFPVRVGRGRFTSPAARATLSTPPNSGGD